MFLSTTEWRWQAEGIGLKNPRQFLRPGSEESLLTNAQKHMADNESNYSTAVHCVILFTEERPRMNVQLYNALLFLFFIQKSEKGIVAPKE